MSDERDVDAVVIRDANGTPRPPTGAPGWLQFDEAFQVVTVEGGMVRNPDDGSALKVVRVVAHPGVRDIAGEAENPHVELFLTSEAAESIEGQLASLRERGWFGRAAPPGVATLRLLLDELWDTLGSGDWLEPGDYEALRERHNRMAQAAEDVCNAARRCL